MCRSNRFPPYGWPSSAQAASFEPEAIAPLLGPLYGELHGRLRQLGIDGLGPDLAWYEAGPDEGITAHAAVPVNADLGSRAGVNVVDLPGIPQAATVLHHGPMTDVMSTLQHLALWVDAHGFRSLGYNRELYLDYGCGDDPSSWVTELQEPIAAR
jgi:effector-binding domain-containing protein